jgi:hypothetical protein
MSETTPETPAPPARTYRSLHVVADELEHDGHIVIGAILDGALVPIAHQAAGLVDQMKARWSGLGGVQVDDLAETAVAGLADRIAALERAVLALQGSAPTPAGGTSATGGAGDVASGSTTS